MKTSSFLFVSRLEGRHNVKSPSKEITILEGLRKILVHICEHKE